MRSGHVGVPQASGATEPAMNVIAEKISTGRRQEGRSYIMRSIEGAKPGLGAVHSVAKCLFIFI